MVYNYNYYASRSNTLYLLLHKILQKIYLFIFIYLSIQLSYPGQVEEQVFCGSNPPNDGNVIATNSKDVSLQLISDLVMGGKGFRVTYNTTSMYPIELIPESGANIYGLNLEQTTLEYFVGAANVFSAFRRGLIEVIQPSSNTFYNRASNKKSVMRSQKFLTPPKSTTPNAEAHCVQR